MRMGVLYRAREFDSGGKLVGVVRYAQRAYLRSVTGRRGTRQKTPYPSSTRTRRRAAQDEYRALGDAAVMSPLVRARWSRLLSSYELRPSRRPSRTCCNNTAITKTSNVAASSSNRPGSYSSPMMLKPRLPANHSRNATTIVAEARMNSVRADFT